MEKMHGASDSARISALGVSLTRGCPSDPYAWTGTVSRIKIAKGSERPRGCITNRKTHTLVLIVADQPA